MGRDLDKMSIAELGELFPIILVEHCPDWAELYQLERDRVVEAVGAMNVVRISHYGSTAVPGLLAKPTIDILLEVEESIDSAGLIQSLLDAGYLYSPQLSNPAPHMMFMKGYTPEGFVGQAYHLHVRYSGDWDELYFRDYLRLHPEVAVEYAALKRQLQQQYEHDREAYTQGKTEFIQRVTGLARAGCNAVR